MVFSADDRVLIKVLRQEKGYLRKIHRRISQQARFGGKLQERVYRSQIHDVDQLKSRLLEEWEHFHQVFIGEAIRQWHPRLLSCIRAHGGHF